MLPVSETTSTSLPDVTLVVQEQQRLRRDIDVEKRARKRLETLLRHSVKSYVENTPGTTTTTTTTSSSSQELLQDTGNVSQ